MKNIILIGALTALLVCGAQGQAGAGQAAGAQGGVEQTSVSYEVQGGSGEDYGSAAGSSSPSADYNYDYSYSDYSAPKDSNNINAQVNDFETLAGVFANLLQKAVGNSSTASASDASASSESGELGGGSSDSEAAQSGPKLDLADVPEASIELANAVAKGFSSDSKFINPSQTASSNAAS